MTILSCPDLPTTSAPTAADPYDPWMTPLGIWARENFYGGHFSGKILAASILAADWMAPTVLRNLMHASRRSFPVTTSQWILLHDDIADPELLLGLLLDEATPLHERFGLSWGLGFPWMSKNGLYGPEIPFVTHTPYAMEALLHLGACDRTCPGAREAFLATRQFLESLLIMHDSPDQLALSYAPVKEPRIVVNANAYACFAYALHAAHGERKDHARREAIRLANWVCAQQLPDGSWRYYADSEPGNFIDCFHTCFVVKNLLKAGRLIEEVSELSQSARLLGKQFIDRAFFDHHSGLVKRFVERDIKDPYKWDIYDQAEYLGLMIDFDEIERAVEFRDKIVDTFCHAGNWYCRSDIFGRLWGKNFLRWGIMPFFYHSNRLDKRLRDQ